MSDRTFITLTTTRPDGSEVPIFIGADAIAAITSDPEAHETRLLVGRQWTSVKETSDEVHALLQSQS
jgi:hypothetical protein